MEVLMEANPVTRKIWKEWCEEDKRLSLLTEEERMNLVSQYQWLFPKEENDFVDLEFLYTRKHIKSSREKFQRKVHLPITIAEQFFIDHREKRILNSRPRLPDFIQKDHISSRQITIHRTLISIRRL